MPSDDAPTAPPPTASTSSTSASAPLAVVPKSEGAAGPSRKSSDAAMGGGGAVSSAGNSGDHSAAGLKAGLPLEGAGQAVSSPAELMSFVDTMLAQLEDKFNESSTEVLERMTTMSTRIDSLEMAISDIINGEIMPSLPSGPLKTAP